MELSEAQQAAVRFLLATEPLVGQLLPSLVVLERLSTLLRGDLVAAVVRDREGYVLEEVTLASGRAARVVDPVGPGPPRLGVAHWNDGPHHSLAAGFRNGKDRLVQFWWDRRSGTFSEADVAVLQMIAPALQRLVRDAAAPVLPTSLTAQERRTVTLVADGLSNGEIAQRMDVAQCTVRKHLEHAYRKLGVTNRLAAAVALRGGELAPARRYDDLGAAESFA